MYHLRRFNRLIFLALLPVTAVDAQETLFAEEEEIRRYTVEMIIFRYAQDVGVGNEIFVGETVMPGESPGLESDNPLVSQPAVGPDAEDDAEDDADVLRDVEFVLLDREDFTMDEIMGHLRRLDVYEPVMHFGWTQATWPEEETREIQLASLARPPQGLDGSLKLYLSRYLHLVVDLELDAPGTTLNPPPLDESYPDYSDIGAMDRLSRIAPQTGPVRYRIEEDRIFRSGELRYFDHPRFGVLARVTRIEEDQEAADEAELLGYPAE